MAKVKNTQKIATVPNDQQVLEQIEKDAQNATVTEITPSETVLTPMTKSEMLFEAKVNLTACADDIRSNYIKIGKILHDIKVNKLCENSEDFQKIISETLDMSVPTAYRILSTYEKFYLPLSLETDNKTISALEGFKDSTLSRLLPLGDYETIKEHILNGVFRSTMSAREVTHKVADIIGNNKKIPQYNDKDKDKDKDGIEEQKGEDNVKGDTVNKRDNPTTGEPTNFDSEVFAFINEMIEATSLIEVQNKAKAFKLRWFN